MTSARIVRGCPTMLQALRIPHTPHASPHRQPKPVRLLTCAACGATVPPLGDTHARCAFCLARVAIPDEFRRPMAAQSALEHHFAANLAALAQARSSHTFLLIFAKVFGGTILITGLASFVAMAVVVPGNTVGVFAGTAGLPKCRRPHNRR